MSGAPRIPRPGHVIAGPGGHHGEAGSPPSYPGNCGKALCGKRGALFLRGGTHGSPTSPLLLPEWLRVAWVWPLGRMNRPSAEGPGLVGVAGRGRVACARAPRCGRSGQGPALNDLACRDGRDALCPWTGHAAIPPVRSLRNPMNTASKRPSDGLLLCRLRGASAGHPSFLEAAGVDDPLQELARTRVTRLGEDLLGRALSRMTPSSRKQTRSAMSRAKPISCVAITIVIPPSASSRMTPAPRRRAPGRGRSSPRRGA